MGAIPTFAIALKDGKGSIARRKRILARAIPVSMAATALIRYVRLLLVEIAYSLM